jgi:transcriptional regulator with XRE-family HTH domain
MGPGSIGNREHSGSAVKAMYPNLKLQLWKCGIRQNRLAQLIGIHETLLSKIVNGFREPDQQIRSQIAAILRSDESWLFSPGEMTLIEPIQPSAEKNKIASQE